MTKKKVPHFKTDKELEDFLEQDLSDYLHPENWVRVKFEIEPKSESVNLRMRPTLLKTIKRRAKKMKVPYQSYIHRVLEHNILGTTH